MANLFTNNAVGFLNVPINSTVSTIALQAGQGATFPVVASTDSNYFYMTLVGLNAQGQESTWEIVKCTARVNDTLTVERSQMGTTAPGTGWPASTRAALRITAEHATNFNAAFDWGNHASSGYAILTGSQATLKTDSFTVAFGQTYLLGTATGKTISVPVVNAFNDGHMFRLRDPFGTLESNPWTIDYVGNVFGTGKIQGLAEDLILDVSRYNYDFIYSSPTNSWYLI